MSIPQTAPGFLSDPAAPAPIGDAAACFLDGRRRLARLIGSGRVAEARTLALAEIRELAALIADASVADFQQRARDATRVDLMIADFRERFRPKPARRLFVIAGDSGEFLGYCRRRKLRPGRDAIGIDAPEHLDGITPEADIVLTGRAHHRGDWLRISDRLNSAGVSSIFADGLATPDPEDAAA